MRASHVVCMSGDLWSELTGHGRPVASELARLVARLNGSTISSILLWRLPEGVRLNDVDPRTHALEYLQAAGSQERMTVELRVLRDGQAEHYAIGRVATQDGDHQATEPVRWAGHTTYVRPSEVLSGAEAEAHFVRYLECGDVDPQASRRLLHL